MGLFSFTGQGNIIDAISGKGSELFDSLKSYIDAFTGKSNYEAQQDLLQWEKDQYFYNLDYDKPINQMKRLEEAGINPHMAYAKGTVSNTSNPIPNLRAPQFDASNLNVAMNLVTQLQNLEKMQADINNTKAQLPVIEENLRTARAEADIAQHDADIYKTSPIASRSTNWLQTGAQLYGKYGSKLFDVLGQYIGNAAFNVFGGASKNDGVQIRPKYSDGKAYLVPLNYKW